MSRFMATFQKRIIIYIGILFFLLPTQGLAVQSQEEIAKKNFEAKIIVIGKVFDRGAAILLRDPKENNHPSPAKGGMEEFVKRFIALDVVHVVKGDKLKQGDRIHVLSSVAYKTKGEVKVQPEGKSTGEPKTGALVIVYADPVPFNPGFYKPVLGEESVVTLVSP